MTLGQKLRKLRTEKGLTQRDLADRFHVTFQTISKWENDENEPDIATLKELANLYGVSVKYLIYEDELLKQMEPNSVPGQPQTVIVEHKQLHECEKCHQAIQEGDLQVENIYKHQRHGRHTKSVIAGHRYYHKHCYEEYLKAVKDFEEGKKKEKASRSKKLTFGWGIAVGVIALIVSLIIMLTLGKEAVHPGLAVLYSVLISYAAFADIYCILSASYIGDVFVEVSSWSIKFPGLIFTWDIDGFIWAICMKILFAILGLFVSAFVLAFAIVLSAALASVSFPFILIHNIHTQYQDTF